MMGNEAISEGMRPWVAWQGNGKRTQPGQGHCLCGSCCGMGARNWPEANRPDSWGQDMPCGVPKMTSPAKLQAFPSPASHPCVEAPPRGSCTAQGGRP